MNIWHNLKEDVQLVEKNHSDQIALYNDDWSNCWNDTKHTFKKLVRT